jgi:two-component system alkaline phosphatase synthesis response regulator PhoP
MSERKKILIVDDDPDYVTAITHLLQKAGHEVRSAASGRQGFDLAGVFAPDLILLDVMMTERTEGFFTLQRIRNSPTLRKTPVIVVSSIYAETPRFSVDPEAGWLPADLFLPKPVDVPRLLAEAERLMSTSSEIGSVPS